jgi:hypothetical protein
MFLSKVKPAVFVQEDYTDACWDNHCVFQGNRKSAGRCDMESIGVRQLSPAWLAIARSWASKNGIETHPLCTRVCDLHRAEYGLVYQGAPTGKVQRLPRKNILELSCCMPPEHCSRKSKSFYYVTSDNMMSVIPGTTAGEITYA